jgi:hypothetical protein
MSRRPPNPAAERAAQNTQTIKSLLKLEGNKTCADCKRNKRELYIGYIFGGVWRLILSIRRSKMGELEFGNIHLYKMFGHTQRHGNTYQ